jgi:hypothetical protein
MKTFKNFMKAVYITVLLVLISTVNVRAQYQVYKDAKSLKNKESKLHVVLNSVDTTSNSMLKEALNKYWTFCDYDFIDVPQALNYLNKEGNYIMTVTSEYMVSAEYGGEYIYQIASGSSIKSVDRYSYKIIKCSKKNNVKDNTSLFYIQDFTLPSITVFNKKGKSTPERFKAYLTTYDYMIPLIIISFNSELEQLNENGKKDNDIVNKFHSSTDKTVYYLKGAEEIIKKMDILVCEDSIKDQDAAKKSINKKLGTNINKIKFVSSSEISKAIENKSEDTGIFMGYSTGNFMIFSVKELKQIAYGLIKSCYIYSVYTINDEK